MQKSSHQSKEKNANDKDEKGIKVEYVPCPDLYEILGTNKHVFQENISDKRRSSVIFDNDNGYDNSTENKKTEKRKDKFVNALMKLEEIEGFLNTPIFADLLPSTSSADDNNSLADKLENLKLNQNNQYTEICSNTTEILEEMVVNYESFMEAISFLFLQFDDALSEMEKQVSICAMMREEK